MRALIYVRQSLATDELAIERQRTACEQLCQSRNWTVVDVVPENDTSATSGPRPKYAEVLERMGRREFDVLVVWHVDRLVRRLDDLEHLIGLSERTGVKVATASGDLDLSTDAGRLVGRILASVARAEVERKGTRQRAADFQRAEAGLPHLGGARAFGYEQDGMTIREEEAEVIRAGYQMLIVSGALRGVARMWEDAGQLSEKKRWSKHDLRPTKGWATDSVADILRNPRYAAIRTYKHPDGRVEEFPAAWPEIVPEGTYRAALAILNDPARSPNRSGALTLLSGIALCGMCEAPVHSGGRRQGQRAYRCGATHGHVSRQAEPVEHVVWRAVVKRMCAEDAADLVVDHSKPNMPALIAERESVRQDMITLAREFAEEFNPAQMRAANKVLKDKLARIQEAIAEAGRWSVLGPLLDAEDTEAALEDLDDMDSKRAVVDELMTVRLLPVGRGRRVFRPESVEIIWKV